MHSGEPIHCHKSVTKDKATTNWIVVSRPICGMQYHLGWWFIFHYGGVVKEVLIVLHYHPDIQSTLPGPCVDCLQKQDSRA